jgi:dCMP deaminase
MVGAVLVQDGVVRGTGYNGAPSGMPECTEVGCDEDSNGHCIRAVHAEANVLISTDVADRAGATVYCTDMPCFRCANLIANTAIARVVWARPFPKHADRVNALLAAKGITNERYELPLSPTGALLVPEPVLARLGLTYVVNPDGRP